ncbi:MAG: L-2-hydroxyglutarate oxidase [Actinobacteria bacterium]|nr:L-2-hydroxyglutarate oxidase [Actinomycetota bacterium]
MIYDFLVVGCGIIGLTIAIEIKKTFGGKVCIIEKESTLGAHASGRNSGVLHAGIYYKPGTLKGQLSVEGNRQMREYCQERGIRQSRGKVIVTKNEKELEALRELKERALANGADVSNIDERELKEIEPYAKTVGLALYSPNTITIDPKEVLNKLLEDAKALGIEVAFDTKLTGLKGRDEAITSKGSMSFGLLVNAAGAYADKIAHMFGLGMQYTMVPYKGIYFRLKDEYAHMVRSNIYPVPDIRFPFLGVHFTRTPNGIVKIGPTAIPAFSKENYSFFDNIKKDELNEVLYCNAKKLLTDKNYMLLGIKEVSKYIPFLFYKEAKKLLPALKYSHIISYPSVGIRAQLFDKSKQELEMDFIVLKHDNSLHILNAVSPAFTSAITFAKYVTEFID